MYFVIFLGGKNLHLLIKISMSGRSSLVVDDGR